MNISVEIIDGVEHRFAPNPFLQGEVWEKQYPPIKSDCKFLINKYTGEIVPNTEEFARRSDILQPYLGEMTDEGMVDVDAISGAASCIPEEGDHSELEML